MFFKIFFLMTAIPIIELYVIFQAHDLYRSYFGSDLALIISLGSIIVTGFIGAKLTKKQGLSILRDAQTNLNQGRIPADALYDGLLVAVGGVMLLTPGYLTDVVGFMFIIPVTRIWFKLQLERWFRNQVDSGRVFVSYHQSHQAQTRNDDAVVVDITPHSHKKLPEE